MPQPTNDRPAPPAPRLHRLLSSPVGWLAFLMVEGVALFGLLRVIPFERLPSSVAVSLELGLIVAAVVVNYRIRRLYLSDWWNSAKR